MPVPGEASAGEIGDVFVGQDRLLGTRSAWADGTLLERSVVASTDGSEREVLGSWPGLPGEDVIAIETSTGMVAVGLDEADRWLTVWRSIDTVGWTESLRETGRWRIAALAGDGDSIVVAGHVLADGLADEDAPATLTTPDGVTWSQSLGDSLPTSRYPIDVAINDGVIVMLVSPRVGEPTAWRAGVR